MANCSLPSLTWLPSSDDVMCVKPSGIVNIHDFTRGFHIIFVDLSNTTSVIPLDPTTSATSLYSTTSATNSGPTNSATTSSGLPVVLVVTLLATGAVVSVGAIIIALVVTIYRYRLKKCKLYL